MGIGDDGSQAPVKLYVRLPVKIEDEQQVKDLHLDILKVTLPRQKSRRWCTVEFKDVSKLPELKKVKVGGKKIVVKILKAKKYTIHEVKEKPTKA